MYILHIINLPDPSCKYCTRPTRKRTHDSLQTAEKVKSSIMSTNILKNSEHKLYKRWTFGTLSVMAAAFILTAFITVYRDPFFHYHAPLPEYNYPQKVYPDNNERYLNDGISRNFSYDGIITGTSMTENFKTSEADELFDANFIKVSYAGAKYKEINDNLKRAYEEDKEIKYIIRGLDCNDLILDKDAMDETFDYPTYLYNNNPFDDVSYVLNKSVLFEETLQVTKAKDGNGSSVHFDTYGNWYTFYETKFGAPYVLATYQLRKDQTSPIPLTEEEKQILSENLRQNVTELAAAHPETAFYLFFPPYSICYWDLLNNTGQIDRHMEAEKLAIEELLQYPNIKLYSFFDDFELVCNLDHYKDYLHYGESINSLILKRIKKEENLLTQDNYKQYLKKIEDFYHSYDYDSLHP